MPRIAISPDFLAELERLTPQAGQAVVDALTAVLRGDPAAPYPERVRNSPDARLHTIRLGALLRGVVVVPPQGDVHWLLSVLTDDEAHAYARRHRITISRTVGTVEIWDTELLAKVIPALKRAAERTSARLFDHVSDPVLVRLGVDEQVIPLIRLLGSESHLRAIEPILPESQFRPLDEIARGKKVSGDPVPDAAYDDDLVAALERSPHLAAFAENEDELLPILTSPDWRTFLTPEQRDLARHDPYDTPVLVTGGPGTGKTLVALHRAAHLATEGHRAAREGPILIATYNRSLASRLEGTLEVLIKDEEIRKRIEVLNADRLAQRIVTQADGAAARLASSAEVEGLFAEAPESGQGPAFLRHEWEQVVLAQNLRTEDEYLRARRFGVPLDPGRRARVWRAIGYVVERLGERGRCTWLQLAARAADLMARSTGDLLAPDPPASRPYRHVIVDEAQDLHPAQWRLLRVVVPTGPDDLFAVGDPYQRIGGHPTSLSAIGIAARTHRLTRSHRMPEEIASWAVRLRGGGPVDGLVDGADSLHGYRSAHRGERPMIVAFSNRANELDGLVARLQEWLDDGVDPAGIAVTARTSDLVREVRTVLEAAEIPVTSLPGSTPRVAVGMMQSMKGLEFHRVAVIGADLVPVTTDSPDPIVRAQELTRERALLFMACTRAREMLYLSYSESPSPFLPS
ncbi:UvrD-helicase domain-containing protein [Rhizohabitans arisaemae]|uniref:UvrD-helicase domain-containing protein n=1 Tax=Rhizohabitans arisaemae TaxID=2720610 RepID=UPI0024B094B7|nr:UvrD-helicase domain-containing protein [Rhizohabitans arisaemae]